MKSRKVSIIIPVYNVEHYLQECVESIRTQTLKDIEIILIDDESPDNCPAICDNYSQIDERIVVVHKKNGGLGFARNTGLEIATGEYVSFLDSDDYERPETYERLYDIAINSQCDAVYYRFIDNKDEDISLKTYVGRNAIEQVMLDMIANPPEKANDRDVAMSSCTALYKRSVIINNHISFHSERELISEDLVFNLDFLNKTSKIVITNYKFYNYRVNSESLTHHLRKERHQKNSLFYHYLLDRVEEIGLGIEGKQRCMRMIIGYSRSNAILICQSDMAYRKQREWVKEIMEDPIWRVIYQEYPIGKLPFLYNLFFILTYRELFFPLWMLSNVKRLIGVK